MAMLDIALRAAAPGALIPVAAFGSGCDALLLQRTDVPCPGAPCRDAGQAESSYMKYLSFTGQIDSPWGMRAEMDNKTALTAAWRDHGRIVALRRRALQRLRDGAVPALPGLRATRECRAQDTQQVISLPIDARRACCRTPADFLGLHARPAVPVRPHRLRGRRPRADGVRRHRPSSELAVGCRCAWSTASRSSTASAGSAATSGRRHRPGRAPSQPLGRTEWPAESATRGRHRRHGLLALRRALGLRRRRPDARGLQRGAQPMPASQRSQIEAGVVRRVPAKRTTSARPPVPLAQALRLPRIAGDARRERLRHRHRGAARRGLRGRRRRLRHRARARRREAQGHRLRRPAGAHARRRQRPVAAQLDRAGRVRAARLGLRRPSTAWRWPT